MSDNTPPSQMLRVPSALVDAVKDLSRLHRSGYTSAVLTGLQQLIASIDSTADSVTSVAGGKSDTELLAELIAGLDERIAAQVAVQVGQLEQRMATQLGEHVREGFSRACDLGRELERAKQQSPSPDELAIGEGARLEQLPGGITKATTPALKPVEILDDVSAIPNIPVSQEVGSSSSEEGKTASFLAERFKKSVSTITRRPEGESEEEFKEWSRKLDPDDIPWVKRQGNGRRSVLYYPYFES